MIETPTQVPISFSVSLIRQPSTSSSVAGVSGQNWSHYNLRRLSRQSLIREASAAQFWYGKAGENVEIQVHEKKKRDSLRLKRLSGHLRFRSEVSGDEVLPIQVNNGDRGEIDIITENLEAPASTGEFLHIKRNVPPDPTLAQHAYNLPNSRFCVVKNEIPINYVDNPRLRQLAPKLSSELIENIFDPCETPSDPPTECRISPRSSIYSEDTEASFFASHSTGLGFPAETSGSLIPGAFAEPICGTDSTHGIHVPKADQNATRKRRSFTSETTRKPIVFADRIQQSKKTIRCIRIMGRVRNFLGKLALTHKTPDFSQVSNEMIMHQLIGR